MKYYIQFIFIIVISVFIGSCSKDSSPTPLAALNVVNAAVNTGSVQVNYWGTNIIYATCPILAYGVSAQYGLISGNPQITIVASTDTLHSIYNKSIDVQAGGIYSLFLAGQTGAIDTLFIQDNLPVHADSSCGVRFINLSYNSNPIIISQTATPTVTDFTNLSYKNISTFKKYVTTYPNNNYAFQVRDATTNTILGTYTLATPYFQNVTLAWIGQTGGIGTVAPKIIRINNY